MRWAPRKAWKPFSSLFSYSAAFYCTAQCLRKQRRIGSATIQQHAEDYAGVLLTVKLESGQKSKDKILIRIDAYCLFHLERFIIVVSVGGQNQSATPVELVTDKRPFPFQSIKSGPEHHSATDWELQHGEVWQKSSWKLRTITFGHWVKKVRG